MGSFGVLGKPQSQSNSQKFGEPLLNPSQMVVGHSSIIEVAKPSFIVVDAIEQINKPAFKIVDKVEIVNKPVYETTEIRHIIEIPKPELGRVNQSLTELQTKLESLAAQVPMLPTVKTEVISVLSSGALFSIIALSASNIIALGVIAWLLN